MTTDLITKTLNKAARDEALVELFFDRKKPHQFVVALVQGCTAGVVTLIDISLDGEPHGVSIAKISGIVKLKVDTPYIVGLTKLLRNKGGSRTKLRKPLIVGKRGVSRFLRGTRNKNAVITVKAGKVGAEPYCLNGYLVAHDRACLTLKLLDSNGDPDGTVVYRRKYIDSIESGSKLQRRLTILGAR